MSSTLSSCHFYPPLYLSFNNPFLRKMWPNQFAVRLRISCRIFPCFLTVSNTSSFLTWSVQLIFSILLQHHISKLCRCFWSTARSIQVSAPYKASILNTKIKWQKINAVYCTTDVQRGKGCFIRPGATELPWVCSCLLPQYEKKLPCSLQFAAFIECHPQPSYVSTAVGPCPVPNLQALSAWLSIRDHTSTFCCARLPHTEYTCKCRGKFCQIAEFLL